MDIGHKLLDHVLGPRVRGISNASNARLIVIRFKSGQNFLILFINYSVSSQNFMNWTTVKPFLT